jgi:adenosylhomocysteine nucleosidase
MTRIAIIAALDREIAPFVRGWTPGVLHYQHRQLACYRREDLAVVIGGIGARQAEFAARAAIAELETRNLISAGLGGAIISTLKAGSIFIPNVIVDAASRTEYRCNAGASVASGGILVSAPEIAGTESKKSLADEFHALVVDMEAAAVARVCGETKTGFFCVKAISDELDSRLPPLNHFVNGSGRFQTGKYVAWVGLRPHWWPATVRLARDSNRAARILCDWLGTHMTESFAAPPVVTLESAQYPNT